MFKKASVKCLYLGILGLIIISILTLSPTHTAHAASPRVSIAYRTDSIIEGGKTNYDPRATRFVWAYLGVNGGDSKSSGTIEIKDAQYTFGTWDDWRGKKGTTVNNGSRTFGLSYVGAADDGLSEKTVSWTLGKVTGEVALPKIRSTSEQLSSYAPYVEYILTDDKVTGIILRMIKPDEPEKAIIKEDGSGFKEFWRVNLFGLAPRWEHLQEIKVDKKFKSGDSIEVELKVTPPQTPRFIGVVEVWYKDEAQADGADVWQRWNFYKRNA